MIEREGGKDRERDREKKRERERNKKSERGQGWGIVKETEKNGYNK